MKPLILAVGLLLGSSYWSVVYGSVNTAYRASATATLTPTPTSSVSTTASSAAAVTTKKSGNAITGLFGYVKNSITRTIDGCQELWSNYGTCKEIRAKVKLYQDKQKETWVRQGLYEPNSKALKERLQTTIGGISFEEYAFLQKGKEDRGKLMSLAFIVFGAPRFLPYALMFQPEMLPSPLKPPQDASGGETKWEKQSRERATVLLETIVAAYEMEEILYELRDHSLGLNCGRWDYLFSYIKKFKAHGDKLAPDRSHLTMTTPLMEAYVKRLIYICHRRGTFAMGGMSASIPIKDDPKANEIAMNKVREGKWKYML